MKKVLLILAILLGAVAPVSAQSNYAEGFPPHIVGALRCVTKLSDDEPYDEFIERVKTNQLAVAVKINDLAHNMDIRRCKELSDWDVKRLKKYLKAYHELTK